MDATRWLRHWFHAPASRAFPPAAMQEIQAAIAAGEVKHDGEICFAVAARTHAENVFADLKVWDTERRTGVLIYVLLGDYTIEIIPDRGVVARVPEGSWERIIGFMAEQFRKEQWKEGALDGIIATHNLLELYLPPGPGRRNALPDEPIVL